MKESRAELLLASVIVARSTSFVFNKLGLGTLSAFNMLAVRFLLAFALLALLFRRKLRGVSQRTVGHGAILGGIFFVVMSCEMFSLKTVDSGVVSLLENMSILFVPLLQALVLRRWPKPIVFVSAAVAVTGVFLLSLRSGHLTFGLGQAIALGAAVLYAGGILCIDRFSHEGDAFVLGMLQVGFLGAFSLVGSVLFESPRLPQTGSEWGIILALVVVCTGFGYTLQPVAQSHTTAQRAGLFCALSPACATVLGAVILHEQITPVSLAGIVLILLSLLLPQVQALLHHRRLSRTAS